MRIAMTLCLALLLTSTIRPGAVWADDEKVEIHVAPPVESIEFETITALDDRPVEVPVRPGTVEVLMDKVIAAADEITVQVDAWADVVDHFAAAFDDNVEVQQFVVEGPASAARQTYWLGMQVAELPEALRGHLHLAEGGALVQHVVPEGPAGKAGIRNNDVLLSVADKPLKKHDELTAVLNKAEGQELTIVIIQGGERKTVKVVPENRPVAATRTFVTVRDLQKTAESYAESAKEAAKTAQAVARNQQEIVKGLREGFEPVRMAFVQPGVPVPKDILLKMGIHELPDDVTVRIQKHGKQPSEIEVKQGEKTWNVKEDDLKSLPAELRPHVERMLGRGNAAFRITGPMPDMPAMKAAPAPPVPPTRGAAPRPAPSFKSQAAPMPPAAAPREAGSVDSRARVEATRQRSTEQQLESMSRTLEQMRHQIEEMRKENR